MVICTSPPPEAMSAWTLILATKIKWRIRVESNNNLRVITPQEDLYAAVTINKRKGGRINTFEIEAFSGVMIYWRRWIRVASNQIRSDTISSSSCFLLLLQASYTLPCSSCFPLLDLRVRERYEWEGVWEISGTVKLCVWRRWWFWLSEEWWSPKMKNDECNI